MWGDSEGIVGGEVGSLPALSSLIVVGACSASGKVELENEPRAKQQKE